MSIISCLLAGIEFCGRAASQLLTCWQIAQFFGGGLLWSDHPVFLRGAPGNLFGGAALRFDAQIRSALVLRSIARAQIIAPGTDENETMFRLNLLRDRLETQDF